MCIRDRFYSDDIVKLYENRSWGTMHFGKVPQRIISLRPGDIGPQARVIETSRGVSGHTTANTAAVVPGSQDNNNDEEGRLTEEVRLGVRRHAENLITALDRLPSDNKNRNGWNWDSSGLIQWRRPTDMYFKRRGFAEIGNLDMPSNMNYGSKSTADIEILCDRNTILGNPFNAYWDKHCRLQNGRNDRVSLDTLKDMTVEEWHKEACGAFQEYMAYILDDDNYPCGNAPIDDIASDRIVPLSISNKWRVKDIQVEKVREAMAILARMRGEGKRLRYVCHCAPRECHTQLLADIVEYVAGDNSSNQNLSLIHI